MRKGTNVQRPTSNVQRRIEEDCGRVDREIRRSYSPVRRQRRGSQVVRSGSAKPLFAGSIPAPASNSRAALLQNRNLVRHAGSIDSLSPRKLTLAGFVYVARLPPAPFPSPPHFISKMSQIGTMKYLIQNETQNKSDNVWLHSSRYFGAVQSR